MSEPFHTSLGFRGRVTIPSALQEEVGIGVGDRLIVRADKPGVIVIETPEAARLRIGADSGEEKESADPGDEK